MGLKRYIFVINLFTLAICQVTDTRIDTVSHLNRYSTHLTASDYFLALEIACKIGNLNSTVQVSIEVRRKLFASRLEKFPM